MTMSDRFDNTGCKEAEQSVPRATMKEARLLSDRPTSAKRLSDTKFFSAFSSMVRAYFSSLHGGGITAFCVFFPFSHAATSTIMWRERPAAVALLVLAAGVVC